MHTRAARKKWISVRRYLFHVFLYRPQIVREKMICHSIIGNSIGKEVIMRVNVKAEFISPLLQFSERKIDFCVLKVYFPLFTNMKIPQCFWILPA